MNLSKRAACVGARGPGPFENEAAGRWTRELHDIDMSAIRSQLQDVVRQEHVDAPDGRAAIAAAEVVAACAGAPLDPMPAEVRTWIAAHPDPPDAEDRRLAAAAVVRVRENGSELADLWCEAEGSAWDEHCDDLLARLGAS